MKKFLFLLLTVASVSLMPGCSEKFNVAAPYKSITVIYGLLDEADTAHYVRIQKAFLDQNKSALTMAQSPDSNFFASLDVIIKRISFSNTLHDIIHLNKVDLTAEGYQKQPGVFFTAPNYAYKFKDALDPNYIYRIVVTNPTTGEVDSADAPVFDDNNPNVFRSDIIDDTAVNRGGFDFASTLQNKYILFNCTYNAPSNFTDFQGHSSPAYIAQAIVRFQWLDSNMLNGTKTPHYYDFDLGYQLFSYGSANYQVDDIAFYNALSTGMGTAGDHIARLIDRCLVSVYFGTADYYTYYQTTLTQGTGLTGTEIEPVYTNVHGKNALGLYTGRGGITGPVNITLNTIDSLIISPYFSKAHISGTAYH